MGTHVPYGITQCYLPPGRGDIPAFTPAEVTWVTLEYQTFTCPVLSEIVNRTLHQNWTVRSNTRLLATLAQTEAGVKAGMSPLPVGTIKWPRRDVRLSWPSWLVTYRDGIPAWKTVTHPSTNRAQCGLTSFVQRTLLTTMPHRQLRVNYAKTAESIEMLFGARTHMGPRKLVLDERPSDNTNYHWTVTHLNIFAWSHKHSRVILLCLTSDVCILIFHWMYLFPKSIITNAVHNVTCVLVTNCRFRLPVEWLFLLFNGIWMFCRFLDCGYVVSMFVADR